EHWINHWVTARTIYISMSSRHQFVRLKAYRISMTLLMYPCDTTNVLTPATEYSPVLLSDSTLAAKRCGWPGETDPRSFPRHGLQWLRVRPMAAITTHQRYLNRIAFVRNVGLGTSRQSPTGHIRRRGASDRARDNEK